MSWVFFFVMVNPGSKPQLGKCPVNALKNQVLSISAIKYRRGFRIFLVCFGLSRNSCISAKTSAQGFGMPVTLQDAYRED